MNTFVFINGEIVSLLELSADVTAAINKGYSGKFAFTPETVKALIEKIEELAEE